MGGRGGGGSLRLATVVIKVSFPSTPWGLGFVKGNKLKSA